MDLKSNIFHTHSAAGLRALARDLLMHGGRVFLLHGQLGAGKTTFVRGLAQALGWRQAVPSPSFTLMKEYPVSAKRWVGRYDKLVHIDLYRLQDEVNPLPMEEWLENERAVVAIEWPMSAWRGRGAVEVCIELSPDESRTVRVIPLA